MFWSGVVWSGLFLVRGYSHFPQILKQYRFKEPTSPAVRSCPENGVESRGSLKSQSCLFKVEAGIAGTELRLVAVAEVAEEVGFPFSVGE